MLLAVDRLSVAYGDYVTVRDVSFTVPPGEALVLLGGNGAGKSTTLGCIVGLARAAGGAVTFDGLDITGLPPHRVTALGIALVPEGRRLFPHHTVRENLELGAYRLLRQGRRAEFERSVAEAVDLFPRIAERYDQPAGQLSGGEQQMVAIARALVGRPRLLMLDEPSLGLSPLMAGVIFRAFARLKAAGLSLVIAEQFTAAALACCERAVVLQAGRVALAGSAAELAASPDLVATYLGTLVRPDRDPAQPAGVLKPTID